MAKICPKMSYRSDVDIDEGKVVFCVEQECAMYYVGNVGSAGGHAMECTFLADALIKQELAEVLDDIRKSLEAINECVAVGLPITVDESPGLVALAQAVIDRLRKTL